MLLTSYDLNVMLSVSATLVLGLAAFSLCRFERRCRDARMFWNSPTGTALSDKSAATDSLSVEVAALQETVRELRDAIGQFQPVAETQQTESDRRMPFDNAVRMAKNGATTDDLTKTCGLNVGEAHLLKKLHSARINRDTRAH